MRDWSKIKYFRANEFNQPDKMNWWLICMLDILRAYAKSPIIIHSSYREGDNGTHGRGEAVDLHIVGMSVIDQFLLAEKTRLFCGIGVYPFWNNPGLHLDVRNLKGDEIGKRWGRNAAGIYVALDAKFLLECM